MRTGKNKLNTITFVPTFSILIRSVAVFMLNNWHSQLSVQIYKYFIQYLPVMPKLSAQDKYIFYFLGNLKVQNVFFTEMHRKHGIF